MTVAMVLEAGELAHPHPNEWGKLRVYWGYGGLDGGKSLKVKGRIRDDEPTSETLRSGLHRVPPLQRTQGWGTCCWFCGPESSRGGGRRFLGLCPVLPGQSFYSREFGEIRGHQGELTA